MQQGILSEFGNARVMQMTLADATVKILLQLRAFFTDFLDGQQMFPFAPSRRGHGIRQPKGDELDQPRIIAMWQITTFMPPQKVKRPLFVR